MRRRIVVGGMVVLGVASVAAGGVKMSQEDAERVEEQTGTSVEEMTEEELIAAMEELGIESIELTDDDQALITDAAG